ncbi:MAG: hypothetical protein COZ18_00155 [Flexibacter sp. CG_4_10_14_3_um_filter_32_15]|nr:MAG: hypothetical protein COZ18_00155 [Flexibacter sp. CG_4_10_14_3_um_filter_32_15]
MNTPTILKKTGNFTNPKTCPSCQHTNYVWEQDVRYMYCYKCGVTSDLAFNRTLNESLQTEDFPYYSFLRVGQILHLEEKEFIITARLRYRSAHKEYYTSDEGSGYSNEKWYFDTYILRTTTEGKDQTYYLSEDKEGYSLGMPVTVDKTDADPTNLELFTNFYEGRADYRVTEYGSLFLEFFEGETEKEDPYAVGTQTYFATYQEGMWSYTVEQGDGWKEFSAEKKISKEELYKALEGNPFIDTYQERDKGFSTIRKVTSAAAVVAFLVFLVSLFSDGTPISTTRVDTKDIDKIKGYLSKPIKIDDTETNYNIEWSINFKSTQNQGMYVVVELLDKDKNVINAVESDFWYETGRDSEGNWTESATSESKYFKFLEEGNYFARIYAKTDSTYFNTASKSQAIINFTVNKGALMSRYFLMLSGFLTIVALFISFGKIGRTIREKYIYAGIKDEE